MPENIKYTGAPTLTPEEARRTAAIEPYRLSFPEVRLTRAGAEAGAEIGRATGVLGGAMTLVGRSIDSLGARMEGAGNELWNRAVGLKQLEVETKVNNATVAWEQGQIKSDEKFKTLSGEAANSGALEAHLKASEEARQKVRNSFGSQYEQRMFDQQTMRIYNQSMRASANHAAQETKTHAKQAIDAKIGLTVNSIASAKEDVDSDAGMQSLARIWNDEKRYAHGYNDDQVHRGYQIDATRAIAARAERVASEGDPAHAMNILESNKQILDDVDTNIYRVAYDKVKAKADDDASRVIADKSTGDKDETLEIKENRAMEELKRIGRDKDQRLIDMTMSRLRNKDSVDRQKRAQDREQAFEFVNDAFHGRAQVQNGKKPVTPEEAMAIPGMDEMWPKLTPQQQEGFRAVIKANARGNFDDTPETRATYKYWAGMFELDKDEMRRKYQEDPLWIDKLPIPENFRKSLETKELALLREGIRADEKYIRPKTIIERGKQDGLIPDNISQHQAALLAHRLSAEIEAWRQVNPKKLPTREDENNFINRARTEIEEPGMLWGTNRVEEYKRDIRKIPGYEEARKAFLETHRGATQEQVDQAVLNAYVLRKLRAEQKPATAPTVVRTTPVTPGG